MSDIKIKHYLDDDTKQDFLSEYEKYLENPEKYSQNHNKRKCPYRDIDNVYSKRNEVFYEDLKKFLDKSLKTLNLKFEFEKPNTSDKPAAIRFQDPYPPNEDSKYIYLRSDQFGFSAPRYGSGKNHKSRAWNGEKSYPYARYLSVKCDNKGADDEKKRNFVAECIYETRTIGGSFIWPIVKTGGKYQSIYNVRRGVGGYIEDRVDITLYEIKCFYEVYSQIKGQTYENIEDEYTEFEKMYTDKYPKQILFNIRQRDDEKKAMYRWLKIFKTFERYVKILRFDDFIIDKEDEYLIRDMASEEAKPLKIDEIKPIRQMKPDELSTLLTNVKESTKERTKTIEDESG